MIYSELELISCANKQCHAATRSGSVVRFLARRRRWPSEKSEPAMGTAPAVYGPGYFVRTVLQQETLRFQSGREDAQRQPQRVIALLWSTVLKDKKLLFFYSNNVCKVCPLSRNAKATIGSGSSNDFFVCS